MATSIPGLVGLIRGMSPTFLICANKPWDRGCAGGCGLDSGGFGWVRLDCPFSSYVFLRGGFPLNKPLSISPLNWNPRYMEHLLSGTIFLVPKALLSGAFAAF